MFGGRTPFSQQGVQSGYGSGTSSGNSGADRGYQQTPPPYPSQPGYTPPRQRAAAPQRGPAPPGSSPAKTFKLMKSPNEEFIITNLLVRDAPPSPPACSANVESRVATSPLDFREEQYVLCDDMFVVTIRPIQGFPQGFVGVSSAHRDWARWSLTDTVTIVPYDPFSAGKQAYLGNLDLEVGFASKKITDEAYDQDGLANAFIKVCALPNQFLALIVNLLFLSFMLIELQIPDSSGF